MVSTNYQFTAGNWKIVWIGFEGRCSGSTSVRYSENGDQHFFNTGQFSTHKHKRDPISGSAILFSSALTLLLYRKRSKK